MRPGRNGDARPGRGVGQQPPQPGGRGMRRHRSRSRREAGRQQPLLEGRRPQRRPVHPGVQPLPVAGGQPEIDLAFGEPAPEQLIPEGQPVLVPEQLRGGTVFHFHAISIYWIRRLLGLFPTFGTSATDGVVPEPKVSKRDKSGPGWWDGQARSPPPPPPRPGRIRPAPISPGSHHRAGAPGRPAGGPTLPPPRPATTTPPRAGRE